MITTNDEELYELLLMLRKHGGKDKYNVDYIGYNARLDTIQAAVILAKLSYIDELIGRRRQIASIYNKAFENIDWIETPTLYNKAYHVYHQYTIKLRNKNRDLVQKFLKDQGIQVMVYYPVPLYRMKVFEKNSTENFGELENSILMSKIVLSLPIEPLMSEKNLMKVIRTLTKLS